LDSKRFTGKWENPLIRENGDIVEPEIELPRDIDLRLINLFTSDIDSRLKDLTLLVSLQETELSFLWIILFGLTTYIVIKEHHDSR
jgi:hypothetical protein